MSTENLSGARSFNVVVTEFSSLFIFSNYLITEIDCCGITYVPSKAGWGLRNGGKVIKRKNHNTEFSGEFSIRKDCFNGMDTTKPNNTKYKYNNQTVIFNKYRGVFLV